MSQVAAILYRVVIIMKAAGLYLPGLIDCRERFGDEKVAADGFAVFRLIANCFYRQPCPGG